MPSSLPRASPLSDSTISLSLPLSLSLSLSLSLRDAVERNTRALQRDVCNVEYLSRRRTRQNDGESLSKPASTFLLFILFSRAKRISMDFAYVRFTRDVTGRSRAVSLIMRETRIARRFASVNDSVRAAVKRSRMPTFPRPTCVAYLLFSRFPAILVKDRPGIASRESHSSRSDFGNAVPKLRA